MALIASGLAGISVATVYFTGGIQFVYSHSMYIPIIAAGISFGVPGGVVAGIVGGTLLGPFMPINVNTGEMQSWLNWVLRLIAFSTIGGFVGWFSEAVRRKIRSIQWLTDHDHPTGLPNLRSLEKRLDHAEKAKGRMILALIMPSNLNELRATIGPASGPKLLKLLGERVKQELGIAWKPGVYHVEPDIIGVLFRLANSELQDRAIRQLVDFLERPFRVNGISVHLDCTTGFAGVQAGPKAPSLVWKAYVALMRGKLKNQQRIEYSHGMEVATRHSVGLLGDLTTAIDDGQLRLVYQPKINLQTGKPVGAEALLRWEHPEHGMVPPGDFIPRAEQTALINRVTRWVLDTSCATLREIRKKEFSVAVNVSIRNLADPEFFTAVMSTVRRYGIDPSRIELEITESAIMDDPETALKTIGRFTKQGFDVSIDDFGTGYSSLAYLHRLPAQIIKIDQAFVGNLPDDNHSLVITNTCIQMAHLLGKRVVAEGVETEQSLNYLVGRKCEYGQGYYISKPVDKDSLMEWVERSA